jgi:hypothetical protein
MLDFLKPNQTPVVEPEAKPEAKQEKKTMTLKSQVLAFRNANPSAAIEDIAKACNTSKPYVYQCLNDYKKPNKAKKAKAVNVKPPIAPATVPAKDHEIVQKSLVAASIEIMDLEQEIVGLKAVIKYLEQRLDF